VRSKRRERTLEMQKGELRDQMAGRERQLIVIVE
jgi:hypothetical protein